MLFWWDFGLPRRQPCSYGCEELTVQSQSYHLPYILATINAEHTKPFKCGQTETFSNVSLLSWYFIITTKN